MNTPVTRQAWLLGLLKSTPGLVYHKAKQMHMDKWQRSKTAFDRDWRVAREQLADYQAKVEEAKLNEAIKLEVTAVKRDILTKHEAMEVLTQIAKGEQFMCGDQIKTPNATDRIKAVSELAKMEGWYAPAKSEVSAGVTFESLLMESSVVEEAEVIDE